MGAHTYDILANPHYLDDFQYIAMSVENRENFIIDSDSDETNDDAQSNLTRVALNLGYMTEKNARAVIFDKHQFVVQYTPHVKDLLKKLKGDPQIV